MSSRANDAYNDFMEHNEDELLQEYLDSHPDVISLRDSKEAYNDFLDWTWRKFEEECEIRQPWEPEDMPGSER